MTIVVSVVLTDKSPPPTVRAREPVNSIVGPIGAVEIEGVTVQSQDPLQLVLMAEAFYDASRRLSDLRAARALSRESVA